MDFKSQVDTLNSFKKNTLMETLGIDFTHYDGKKLTATMPVNERVFQPEGILNGGATLALAESAGGPLSLLVIDREKFTARGIALSGNHHKSVSSGEITAEASFIHQGRTTHVIEILIFDNQRNLISSCRLTNIILEK